jgi:hypothetical protein
MILIRTILSAKNGISHTSKLISLVFQQAGPFEKTLRTLLLHQVYILFPKQTSWIGMQRRLSPENGGLFGHIFLFLPAKGDCKDISPLS